MTPQPSDPTERWQINRDGGTGFQDGVHHHHYGGHTSRNASEASRDATIRGVTVGTPITEWDPAALSVHPSITVNDESTLTPYLARLHDRQLRDYLTRAKDADRPTLVLVVGTSCTGKTRALYEAVLEVLAHWPVTVPRSDSDLARLLQDGTPTRTIVWLDELQDLLPMTSSGITAAKAIHELLAADDVGPILFAGTIWPTNLALMQARPDASQAAAGAGAIPTLLTHATVIDVPETFTDADLAQAPTQDLRLHKAIGTATLQAEQGRRVTQVLAGGAQLILRLYPPEGTRPGVEFSPAAKAVLFAAGDLRRVGLPNSIPRWAIEGAAPGYLDPPDHRPPALWLPAAVEEASRDAYLEDALTNTRALDIHHRGVPALTPQWAVGANSTPIEAYDLHDYVFQAHLDKHSGPPHRAVLEQLCDARQRPPLLMDGVSVVAEGLTSHPDLAGPMGKFLAGHEADQEFAAQLAEALYRVPEGRPSLEAFAREGTNPVAMSLTAASRAARTLPLSSRKHAVDIAVIDDQVPVRYFLSWIIRKRWPHAVVKGYDSVENFLSDSLLPRLVIMDMHRPEVLRGVRGVRVVTSTRDAPVLVLTVERRRALASAALEAGAVDYISKMLEDDELLARVATLIGWT